MSPTKINCMDVTHPNSNQPSAQQTIRKSPKKRPLKRYTMVSSSSSTESLASDTKGNRFKTKKKNAYNIVISCGNEWSALEFKEHTHMIHTYYIYRTHLHTYNQQWKTAKMGWNQNWTIYYLVCLARFGLYLKGKSLKRSDNDSEKVHLSMLFLFFFCVVENHIYVLCDVPIFNS